jgi:hypothetical protein
MKESLKKFHGMDVSASPGGPMHETGLKKAKCCL